VLAWSAALPRKESLMFLRSACCIGVAAAAISAAIALVVPPPSWAQTSPPAAPAAPAKPDALPAAPTQAAPQGAATEPSDAFGEDTTLTAKPIVYVKGTGTWDKAFETVSNSFKKVKTYIDKEGLKADGLPMTIYTATDDTGFDYEAAIPVAEPPKNPSRGIAIGQSPEGHALKFVHRGSYDALDDTYEAITNYLDEKRLDAKDIIIEQYVTDPVPSN